MREHFPFGVATGESFFDRKAELKKLKYNLNHSIHTVIIAPRRYGKTSLTKMALKQSKLLFSEVDLFLALDDANIGDKILNGIKDLMQKISKKPNHWLQKLTNYFVKSNKKWTVGIRGLNLELTPENPKTIAENILEALNALEYLLADKKKKAVLFIDEFQEITNTSITHALEGAIRHFAQQSEWVTFIFSGSSRHLLANMFEDKSRPLYELCDEIHLKRITFEDYRDYINSVAEKTWGESLDIEVINAILTATECHPRYTNVLCSYIWEKCEDAPPSVADVQASWKAYTENKLKDIRTELSKRSTVQLKILSAIAAGYHSELSGQAMQSKLTLTSSAIVQALQVLEDQDYIERNEDNKLRIINPMIRTILEQYYAEYIEKH